MRAALVWVVLGLSLGCKAPRRAPTAAAPVVQDDADAMPLRSDAELDRAINDALDRARRGNKRVLLEFVADWCGDCRHMMGIESEPPASEVLAARYERVRVNVGAFDRHLGLLRSYGIDRIAAYVVLDPATGMRIAQTTMEPVSNHRPVSSETWARWLDDPTRPHPR